MNNNILGDLGASERLINDLYIDLRRRINSWAAVTKQTAQARMGYVGQHLVSVVTGHPGGRSGARGRDLVISPTEYGEIKTCYRVDQLGKCNTCGAVVASIEQECSECNSADIKRNDDSKWLISIRHQEEYALIIEPKFYYLVLFDFTDLNDPHTIRASIWEVNPRNPGFAYCMIDYYENIRAASQSKAPFNLWPFQLKFDLMYPVLIYRSYITSDDSISTELFPSRDAPQPPTSIDLTQYTRSRNLNPQKVRDFGQRLGYDNLVGTKVSPLLHELNDRIIRDNLNTQCVIDTLATALYWPDIESKVSELPETLRDHLRESSLI